MMKKRTRLIIGLLVVLLAAKSFTAYGKEHRSAGSEKEFIQEVYEGMLKQEKEIIIYYTGKDYKEIHDRFLDEILNQVFSIDNPDTSSDFDYMKYNLDEVGINTRSDILNTVTITITPKWKESAKQTKAVDKEIHKIMKTMEETDKTPYEKVRYIHDYIVKHVEYDQELESYTAYDALFEGKATCQGYMLLAYKMLDEAGFNVRCIDGIGISASGEESHGWNIIRMGQYWYNFDTTWDDPLLLGPDSEPVESDDISYEYFLQGNIEFSDNHIPNNEFLTPDFMENYPMSSTDFDETRGENLEEWQSAAHEEAKEAFADFRKESSDDPDSFKEYLDLGKNLWITVLAVIIVLAVISSLKYRDK